MPLGNLTSQLFANVYLDRLDQFVKHALKVRYYIRYADDFVFLSEDRVMLERILPLVDNFLKTNLHLTLHPNKIFLRTVASGVDFLGWVHYSRYRVLRQMTKKRMFANLRDNFSDKAAASYFGMLSHGNTRKIRDDLISFCWFRW